MPEVWVALFAFCRAALTARNEWTCFVRNLLLCSAIGGGGSVTRAQAGPKHPRIKGPQSLPAGCLLLKEETHHCPSTQNQRSFLFSFPTPPDPFRRRGNSP